MNITEKAAYLKGLAEGMNLDEAKAETKLINAIIDVVNDLALTTADLEDEIDTLDAYIEEVDEDLGDVEDYLFGDEEDECAYCDEDDCSGCLGWDDFDIDEDEAPAEAETKTEE